MCHLTHVRVLRLSYNFERGGNAAPTASLRWAGHFHEIIRRKRGIMGRNSRALSLIPRERRFYDLFEQQAATIVYSADLLEQALAEVANLPTRQREIKGL